MIKNRSNVLIKEVRKRVNIGNKENNDEDNNVNQYLARLMNKTNKKTLWVKREHD